MSKRPGYETAADLERERRILTAISEAWACQYEKTRDYYPADGASRASSSSAPSCASAAGLIRR